MSRRRETLVVLCVLSLVAVVFLLTSKRPRASMPPLPAGKVEPCFSGDLLLAPDGTLWRIEYAGTGGAAAMSFVPFVPGNDWTAFSGSYFAGMALKENGSLWSWSAHYTAPSTPAIVDPPVQIGSDLDWAQVRHGWNYALLLKRDRSLWFLGGEFRNSNEGFTRLEPGTVPVQVGSDRDWVTVETCALDHYALKQDGTLWHWGNLVYRGPYEPTPQRVGENHDWKKIATRAFSMVALRGDGSIWMDGANLHVIAGDFAGRSGPGPIRVGADSDWVNVVAGHNSLVAQKTDGSWWASGENHYAHLGLPHWFGHSKHLARPTRIPIKLDVWAWNIGEHTTTILTRDGSFYYMGRRPGSARTTSGVAAVQSTINKATRWVPGVPPLFARPGEDWSEVPIKMGELPSSVVSALRKSK